MRDVRRRLAPADRDDAALAVARHGPTIRQLKQARVVAAYWPVGAELDPLPLITGLAMGAEPSPVFCLPVVRPGHRVLEFRLWRPGEALAPGHLSTRQPFPEAAVQTPDAVLVPLLGIDRYGTRLGQGGGYYDATLAHLRAAHPGLIAVGLCFAVQLLETVPREPHDQPLDWIVTEKGAYRADHKSN